MILTHADLKTISKHSLNRLVTFVSHHPDVYPPGTADKILQTQTDPLCYVEIRGIALGIRTLVVLQAGLSHEESARDIKQGYIEPE